MKKVVIIPILLLFLGVSCDNTTTDSDSGVNSVSGEWSIPVSEVRDGGPGRDGIPALANLNFITASEANYLSDTDLVVGVKYNGVIRAYPHVILDWHEIANDDLEDLSLALTYCPLTGTAIGWNRLIGESTTPTTFGVSGLLFNTNLIPFDRATGSNWTQIGLECVNGSLLGEKIKVEQVIETTWGFWKELYPATEVLSTDTGFSRSYDVYPYGDYRTNNSNLIFPVTPLDTRLPAKKRVYTILVNEKSKIYTFDDFEGGKIIRDSFEGKEFVLIGNEEFITSYELSDAEAMLTFSFDRNGEQVFTDDEGNGWDLFGHAISGPRTGASLQDNTGFIAYFFSIGAFYTMPEIYSL